MNDITGSIVIYSFLAFPPTLLIFRFIAKKPTWWIILLLALLFVLVGWFLIIGAYLEEQARIRELIDQGRDEELPEGWDSDGASGVFPPNSKHRALVTPAKQDRGNKARKTDEPPEHFYGFFTILKLGNGRRSKGKPSA